jgi:tetratricopeptide (TPR) repeat protein
MLNSSSRRLRSTFAVAAISLTSIAALNNADAQRTPPPKAAEAQPAQEGLRPDVAKPLQAAQQMIQMRQFKEALSKIAEADLIPNRTPYELFIIERMRGTAAQAANEFAISAKSFTAVLDTNRLAPAERVLFTEAVTAAYYNLKDYKQAATWAARALKEGSTLPQTRMLLIQSLFLADDVAAAKTETDAAIAGDEKSGKVPSEDLLKMMGRIALKQKDQVAYMGALERLVMHYPTKNYWADWIARVATSTTMSDRYIAYVFRLQMALGENLTAEQYMFLARNAMEAGFPIDAKQIMDHGFQAGVLGKSPEHKTLRDKATKDAADDMKNMARTSAEAANSKEGPGLFNSGLNYVISGDKQKGIPMMEEGIKRSGIKRPDDAKMRMGIAYAMAADREKAVATLSGVAGPDGLTEVAKLWTAYAKQPQPAAGSAVSAPTTKPATP